MHSSELPGDEDWKKRSVAYKGKKKYGMEYRHTEEVCTLWKENIFLGRNLRKWRPYWTWYETAKQRDQAMENLAKKQFLGKYLYHEYRPIDR